MGGEASFFKYRISDNRLGRFFSVDPLSSKFPWNSSYAFSENRLIDGVEMEGLEVYLLGNKADVRRTFRLLRKEVGKDLKLSISSSGRLDATLKKSDIGYFSNKLFFAINSPIATVYAKCEHVQMVEMANGERHLVNGGAFGGNTVVGANVGNPSSDEKHVYAVQYLQPKVLKKMGKAYVGQKHSKGALALHEILEAYDGALIAFSKGASTPAAFDENANHPVYIKAHNRNEDLQTVDVYVKEFDENGFPMDFIRAIPGQENAKADHAKVYAKDKTKDENGNSVGPEVEVQTITESSIQKR